MLNSKFKLVFKIKRLLTFDLVHLLNSWLKVFWIMSLTLIDSTAYSQSFGSKVRFFNIEDGMSQSGVNYILLDSRGYLWIATSDGLNRFDGNTFLVFKHIPSDTNSLADNYVRHLCEDADGNIWIATSNGLSRYNRSKGTFSNFYNDPYNSNSLFSNNVFRVYQDKNRNIWVKTIETLDKFDLKENKFVHYQHYNNVFNYASSDFFFDIFEDSKGRLWVGTKDGLNYFDRNLELFKRYEHNNSDPYSISDNRIKAICEDSLGNLWIGTENGLNKFDPFLQKFTRYYNIPNNSNSLINNVINDLYVDKNGILWIATVKGFCSFNPKTEKFTQYKSIVYKKNELNLTGVSSIVLDKSNNLWIGSFEGLTKIDLKPFKFGIYPAEEKNLNYNVTSIYTIDNQTFLIGTRNDGLIKLKQNRNKEFFEQKYSPASLLFNPIYAIFKDSTNKFWIGTGNGLFLFDNITGNLSRFPGNIDFLNNNRIYAFFQDNRKIIWVGSEYGLHQYNPSTGKWKPYIQLPDIQGYTVKSARCFAYDKFGYLWIGTDDGLIRYKIDTKEYKKYLSNPRLNIHTLPSNSIYSLLYTKSNELWIGTNAGLCKYNPISDDFIIYTEYNGLPNNTIYSILEDRNGLLWISSNRGIISFEKSTETFTTFDLADGLQGYEFNLGSAAITAEGQLLFGGINGLNYFFSDSLIPDLYQPSTEITAIEILSLGIKKIVALEKGMTIKIPANTKLFTVYFAALDFTYPSNNKYMYKLTTPGGEGLWINLGNKNFVQFSNLKPGLYTLMVKGSNSDQIWSAEPNYIYLKIETPFYKSRLAIIIYIILIFSGIYWFIKWRTTNLVRQNKELQLRDRQSKEILKQKEELSIKNKNITDSINYARRIQVAMMPSERFFRKILPNSFIFYKPKDIVSGDFYWIQEKNQKIYVAVADCTGHGVPGAFMSILGIELFRNITNLNIDEPGLILDKLNDDFKTIFGDIGDVSLKDGMDVSFCIFDKEKYLLQFAGAQHSLYHVHDNQIDEIKGNRFSIGIEKGEEEEKFYTYTLQLKANEMIYMFSDGYADQFGGPEGKKFKYRRFRHLLLNIHKLPLEQQKMALEETFEVWRGNQEQVDDILIIGIKAQF